MFFFWKALHFSNKASLSVNMVKERGREREGLTAMHPLWSHCNHGNDKCGEKAKRTGKCRNRGDEESRDTAASGDQI